METGIYYNEAHYTTLEDLVIGLDIEKSEIEKLADDWSIMVEETELQPLFQLSADWICERLDEDRMSEEGNEADKIHKLIKDHVDFSKVNELMPHLYYTTGHKYPVTKADLLECVS